MKLLEQAKHWAADIAGENTPRTKDELLIAEVLERVPKLKGGMLHEVADS